MALPACPVFRGQAAAACSGPLRALVWLRRLSPPVFSSCTTCAGTPVLPAPAATCTTRRRRLSLKGDSTTCCSGGMFSSCRMLARVRGAAVADSANTARGCRTLVSRWPNLHAQPGQQDMRQYSPCSSSMQEFGTAQMWATIMTDMQDNLAAVCMLGVLCACAPEVSGPEALAPLCHAMRLIHHHKPQLAGLLEVPEAGHDRG